MKSHLLHGKTWHCRLQPTRHAFVYPMIWLCVDLDELSTLNRRVSLFGHNRRAPVAIHDADYAGVGGGSIRDKVLALLAREKITEPIDRIDLITLPKVFGYAFNPVSFFRCYGPGGQLAVLVTEVGNTFGEKHHYVLQPVDRTPGEPMLFHCTKSFYVSPFNRVEGDYAVRWREDNHSLWLEIDLHRAGEPVMSAGMSGKITPLSTRSLAMSSLGLILRVATVVPLISWQALLLRFRKRVPIFNKPQPISLATLPAHRRSGLYQRLHDYFVRTAASGSSLPNTISPILSLSKETPV